jgi:hypothetical protein
MNVLKPDKARAIARAYLDYNFNQTEALLSLDYSRAYAQGEGHKLFEKPIVQKAIEKLQEKARAETIWNVDISKAKLLQAFELAVACKQPSAMVSAISAINRLYGLDKQVTETIATTEVQEKDRKALKEIGQAMIVKLARQKA